MLLIVDEFIDFINDNEIDFEALEISLLKKHIEKIERNNLWLQN